MRRKNLNQGITLIALVVTIIVLLILAGVSISMVSGDNGIATKAKLSAEKTNKSSQIEEIQLEITNIALENEGGISEEEFEDLLKTYGTLSSEEELLDRTLTTKKDGTKIKVIEIFNGPFSGNEIEINPVIIIATTSRDMTSATISVSIMNCDVDVEKYTYSIKEKDASDSTYKSYVGTGASYTFSDVNYSEDYTVKVILEFSNGQIKEAISNMDPWCFIAGTQVLTESGMRNIEDIQIGDKVYSLNLDTNKRELKEVIFVYKGITKEIYEITVGDETIKTTPKHQFYIVDKGWVRAYDLKEGDMICSKDSQEMVITNVVKTVLDQPENVYNLTVDEYHNYLITESELLVHNAGSSTIL